MAISGVSSSSHKLVQTRPLAQATQISLGIMNTPRSIGLCLWFLAAGAVLPHVTFAQADSTQTGEETWWKGLFRGGQDTPQKFQENALEIPDTATVTMVMDSTAMHPLVAPEKPKAVEAVWSMPDTLKSLDSLAKLDPAPLQGFRVQIYFGDLQEARAVRAAFKRSCPDVASHLHPIDPNYAVTVGNFRDAWSAQRAVQSGSLGAWDNVLVIPSEIDLPDLR